MVDAADLPAARLSLASLRSGPFISGTTHTVLRLGQRVCPVGADDDAQPSLAGAAQAGEGNRVAKKAKGPAVGKRGRGALTLKDLIDAGIIAEGRNKITVVYKGITYTASLGADGLILYQGKKFNSATSFSIHCKRLQTPNKQGDDGWKSVLYEGQPLEVLRRKLTQKGAYKKGRGDDEDDDLDEGVTGDGAEGADAQEPQGTDQWVCCDRCRTWRIVPAEYWPAVEADPRDVWVCEYATWDVAKYQPFKPACAS